jgi:putative ABC transport system permease protein
MNSRDLVGLALRNLVRRKTRTFLAVMGVIVGTCAIVVMLSIGFGMSASFQEQIQSYGNLHLITVYPGGGEIQNGGAAGGNAQAVKLDNKAITEIGKLDGVGAVSPRIEESLTFGIGKYVTQVSVAGVDPEIMEKFNYKVEKGRLLKSTDKNAVVFGNQVPVGFYNPKKNTYASFSGKAPVDVVTDKLIITGDPEYGMTHRNTNTDSTEKKIEYKQYEAKGVGVLANPNDDSSYYAFMNIDALQKISNDLKKARGESISSGQSYPQAMVYVEKIDDVAKVSDAIRKMGMQSDSLNDWLKSMQQQARMIEGVLGGIGAISLLVAALGITNTMVMSIYERTKEIGIMKVIGANLADIKRLFLIEAGMIGFLGGVAGVILSLLISLLMNTLLLNVMNTLLGSIGGGGSKISVIPWWVALGALAFSTTIGILAGFSPAKRAMRLSALESLRNE